MSWVQILLDCLAVISHSFYAKNTTVWAVECDKFETFLKCLPSGDPTIHCLGEIHANTFVATKNRPADWLSFLLRFIWKASQKKNVFKAFLNITFSCKQARKLLKYVLKKSKNRYFVRCFWDHMDPCAYLPKWSCYAPARAAKGEIFGNKKNKQKLE